jgi:phosphinothricin acetyltransferase
MTVVSIDFGNLVHLDDITRIYNQAIRSGTATGDINELSSDKRHHWFEEFDENNLPLYVAILNDQVVGYTTLSPYRPGRGAFINTAEISFFVDYNYHGKGIGSAMISFVVDDCKRLKKDNLIAILLDINIQSIGILNKFGFKKWGHMPDIAKFKDKVCGQYVYGKKIN